MYCLDPLSSILYRFFESQVKQNCIDHISLSKPPFNIKFFCKISFYSHLAPCSFQILSGLPVSLVYQIVPLSLLYFVFSGYHMLVCNLQMMQLNLIFMALFQYLSYQEDLVSGGSLLPETILVFPYNVLCK